MVQLHEISRHKLMQMVLLTFSLWYFHILYKLLLQHGLFFWSLLIDWLLSCTNALLELCHFSVIVCVSPVKLVSVSLFLLQTIFLLADKVIYLSASHQFSHKLSSGCIKPPQHPDLSLCNKKWHQILKIQTFSCHWNLT